MFCSSLISHTAVCFDEKTLDIRQRILEVKKESFGYDEVFRAGLTNRNGHSKFQFIVLQKEQNHYYELFARSDNAQLLRLLEILKSHNVEIMETDDLEALVDEMKLEEVPS